MKKLYWIYPEKNSKVWFSDCIVVVFLLQSVQPNLGQNMLPNKSIICLAHQVRTAYDTFRCTKPFCCTVFSGQNGWLYCTLFLLFVCFYNICCSVPLFPFVFQQHIHAGPRTKWCSLEISAISSSKGIHWQTNISTSVECHIFAGSCPVIPSCSSFGVFWRVGLIRVLWNHMFLLPSNA